MASSFGNLNGSGPQEVAIIFEQSSQNKGGNSTTFRWEVRYYGNGWGSWTNDTQNWSASVAGESKSGTFTIPYGDRNRTYMTLASGYVTKGHNSDGYLSNQTANAYINTNHATIGDGGSGNVTLSVSRIAKRPDKASTPTVTQITPTTAKVSWSSVDSNGSSLTAWRVRWREGATPTSSTGEYVTLDDSARSHIITGLTPGTDYRVVVYAKNNATWDDGGWADYSSPRQFDTTSGAYVSNGSTWQPAPLYVSDGSDWEVGLVKVSDGTTWENAT